MNEHEAERLADLVSQEWSSPVEPLDVEPEIDPPGPRVAGAYWPLGSPAPVRANPLRRVNFVAAKALGTNLVFCFTIDEKPRQYLLCFDLSEWSALDPLLTTGSVYVKVRRLIGSVNWESTQQGVLNVGPSLAIILPEN